MSHDGEYAVLTNVYLAATITVNRCRHPLLAASRGMASPPCREMSCESVSVVTRAPSRHPRKTLNEARPQPRASLEAVRYITRPRSSQLNDAVGDPPALYPRGPDASARGGPPVGSARVVFISRPCAPTRSWVAARLAGAAPVCPSRLHPFSFLWGSSATRWHHRGHFRSCLAVRGWPPWPTR